MALENGIIGERDGVHCSGTLMISGHNLACGHPRDITVLDARMALANSCNTYFATIARRTGAESLGDGLRAYGLKLTGKLDTPEERELLVLGIAGVHVSPMQIAAAYRRLAQQMNAESSAAIVARDGMVQSVETGMARSAHVDGVALAGKTGTAQEVGVTWSHGWFAGIVLDGKRQAQKVIVIYVPNGNGNDAAMLARRVLMREAGR
jgi:cell division protein FtsI/penicillin-binding protein 2